MTGLLQLGYPTDSRSAINGLWHLHLSLPTTFDTNTTLQPNATTIDNEAPKNFANSVFPQTTIADRVAFYLATLFSPSQSTWCKAIDDNLLSMWLSPPHNCANICRRPPPLSRDTWTRQPPTSTPPSHNAIPPRKPPATATPSPRPHRGRHRHRQNHKQHNHTRLLGTHQ